MPLQSDPEPTPAFSTISELNLRGGLGSIADQSWAWREALTKRRLRPSLQRLRNTQLRDGSLYSNIRAVLPILALSIVWLRLVRWVPGPDLSLLLNRSETVRHLLTAISIVSLWNLWLSLSPYQRRSPRKDVLDEIYRLSFASLACGVLLLLWELTRRPFLYGLDLAGYATLGLLVSSAMVLGIFTIGAAMSPHLVRRRAAVVVGTGRRAALVKASLENRYSSIDLYGCVDDEYVGENPGEDGYLGPISQLAELLKTHPIEVVLIGLPMRSKYDEIQRVIEICETVGVESHYMRDIFDTARARVQAHSQVPHDFSVVSTFAPNPKQHLKRLMDFTAACFLLLLFSPVMIAAALAVAFTSPGPIFFIQQRYGLHRKRFPMYKFRTMVTDAEKLQAALEHQNEAQGPVFKLKLDPRITPVGSFLRKTSIDELPQLINVLRGEMSLVGPRPLPHRDVSRFEESWLLRRFSVRPGLTCIWQVNGRSNTKFDHWMRQDLAYIDSWSLSLDLNILFRTIPAVLRGSGAV